MNAMSGLGQTLLSVPNMTSTSLYADDRHEGTYCCLNCRREMLRVEFPFFRKWVMPAACGCVVARMEQERLEMERKNRRAAMERSYKGSIMSERLKRVSFENFQLRKGTENVFHEAKRFADQFETIEQGLFLYGGVGNGKSHLAAAIHHDLERRGYVCLFLDVAQLFNLAKGTFKSSSKVSLTDIINAAVDCDLLTLDEIGSGYLTETEFNDILFPIINGRSGKLTNYTSNLNLKRLKNWFAAGKNGEPLDTDGRLLDRILGSCNIHENLGSSKRQEDAIRRMEDSA